MITCPNCSQKEMEGALFCGECGQLLFDDTIKTSDNRIDSGFNAYKFSGKTQKHASTRSNPFPDALITLYVPAEDAYVPINEENEVIIGRSGEGQSVLPDIDLEKYQAYESGVSRLHASISTIKGKVIITDLGSLNGTSVNKVKIEPHVSYALKDGDVVFLGRFKFEVLI
jgi:pSer/pThr/pTyr-binding forkhead associated (FHA) protein